jgi:hypothetical protein
MRIEMSRARRTIRATGSRIGSPETDDVIRDFVPHRYGKLNVLFGLNQKGKG